VRGPILIGLDGRPASLDALELATRLCERLGAGLIAAYVPQGEYPFTPYDQNYQHHLRAQIEELRERSAPALERVPDGRRREVRPYHAVTTGAGLQELAASEHARLMVVGSSQRTPAGRVLLGSTAARLLTHPPCPIVMAPRGLSGGDDLRLRTVGVALDGCRCSEAALERARELAADLGAELVALSVTTHHGVAPTPAGIEQRVLAGPTARALSIASEDLDLLMVGCRETGGVAGHPTLRSVSRRLLHTSACPLVVVPESLLDGGDPRRRSAAVTPS